MTHHAQRCAVFCLVIAIISCRAADDPLESQPTAMTPEWVNAYTEASMTAPLSSPPAQLYRFYFRGETVFYRPARCCDIPSEVIDMSGTVICQPDGGFSGRGDGLCPDFAGERSDCKLVWSDPRAKPGSAYGCVELARRSNLQ